MLKSFSLIPVMACIFFSCKQSSTPIVTSLFADSLLTHFSDSAVLKANEGDILFWKNRISYNTPDLLNTSKYAAGLRARFALTGDIADIKKADSILYAVSASFNGKEAAPYLSLVSHYISEHRFNDADSLLAIAEKIGLKKYETYATAFDVDFETGRPSRAEADLKQIFDPGDYGYQFRESKMMHYKGNLDSSISAMRAAADLGSADPLLRDIALSNAGDLYMHAGEAKKAYTCYVECIRLNPADLHSITGIGWIALVHDENAPLAEKIFSFVSGQTKSPEPLFKLACAAQLGNDSAAQLKYARAFAQQASDGAYGTMYNKYLLQLYLGILNDPLAALAITQKELTTRATPQTYCWYAAALAANGQTDEAYAVYQQHVSGKPLEGMELYLMGKMMQKLHKGYNAGEFFKESEKTKYDLSPAQLKDLQAGEDED